MEKRELVAGDVVQIDPDMEDTFFGGCFMTVTEPKEFGAQGFIAMPGDRGTLPGRAYFRVGWANMGYIGRSAWVPHDEVPDAEATL